MRAMHKGIHRAYATTPHNVQATVKAVFIISYRLPLTPEEAARAVAAWLQKHACWWGESYSIWVLSRDLAVQGITQVWDTDFSCLWQLDLTVSLVIVCV